MRTQERAAWRLAACRGGVIWRIENGPNIIGGCQHVPSPYRKLQLSTCSSESSQLESYRQLVGTMITVASSLVLVDEFGTLQGTRCGSERRTLDTFCASLPDGRRVECLVRNRVSLLSRKRQGNGAESAAILSLSLSFSLWWSRGSMIVARCSGGAPGSSPASHERAASAWRGMHHI